MNNNLRPELRADKNGRLVTKHVKSDPTAPPKKPLSIPKVFGIKSQINVMGKWDDRTNIKVTDMFLSVDPEGLTLFRDAVLELDDESRGYVDSIVETTAVRRPILNAHQVEANLHYAALLLPVLQRIHPKEKFGYKAAMSVFESIAEHCKDECPSTILLGTDEQKNRVIGRFMSVESHVRKDTTPEQEEWLGANADALLPHFSRLRYQDEIDMDLCRDLVNADASSLSSGIL